MTYRPSTFLHTNESFTTDEQTWESLQQAEASLRAAFPDSIHADKRDDLLYEEASFSSAIENVYQTSMVDAHHAALKRFLAVDLTPHSLLNLHRDIMVTQDHAQPGRYRTVQVVVGNHRPPPPEDVPQLMDEFFSYAAKRGLNAVQQAAWAHLCFEHIHPFADGNGRTGRAVINRILDSPIPLSRYILTHRRSYYRLLDQGTWPEFLDWFIKGVLHKHRPQT